MSYFDKALNYQRIIHQIKLHKMLLYNVYPFAYKDVGVIIFKNRFDAVETVNNAEVNRPKVSDETYYEEY